MGVVGLRGGGKAIGDGRLIELRLGESGVRWWSIREKNRLQRTKNRNAVGLG